ncbi:MULTISPECIES: hypothetical protein [unclassified Streptomyces]|uniref:hypothetical protein n=1 Tax=unclassified Streptomyces TaxID=2593676 RepID=UPI001587A06D|nr:MULTISPECIES: hypothetical protein [unclassified Streptomyces]NUV70083.1 hypothetical protein [Streptomyces sp. CAI-121]NUV99886.1 hypothetical protein [Streptomyces sp. CAI 127]NUW16001.1 hypothetical protein [Streptomyces sp. CAI-68]
MTHIRGPISKFTSGRRVLAAAALTAVTALALTACGTEQNDSGGKAGSAGSSTASQQPQPEQAAAQALFDRFEKACPEPGVNSRRPTGATKPDTEEPETIAPGETPPADPIEPAYPTGPEVELDDRDWCVSAHHEQRVIAALQMLPDPTPATVRKTLNGLGYTDERIHHLKQDGKKTRFYIDLREDGGGRLCESGVAAGAVSDVVPCVAVAEGPFKVTSETRP